MTEHAHTRAYQTDIAVAQGCTALAAEWLQLELRNANTTFRSTRLWQAPLGSCKM